MEIMLSRQWLLYQALEALNKKDLTEIRSFTCPPALVERVMEAVMILRHSEPTWPEAKRQLSKIRLSTWSTHTASLLLLHICAVDTVDSLLNESWWFGQHCSLSMGKLGRVFHITWYIYFEIVDMMHD